MVLAAACLLAVGCVKEHTLKNAPGTPIRFGASTTWENTPATRTAYSGHDNEDDVVHKGSEFERIDWVTGKDQVRILCQAAGGAATYQVNSAEASGQKSVATAIDATDGSLVWGEGDHVFFAAYPVAGMLSDYDDFGAVDGADASIDFVGTGGNAARIFGRVPYQQLVHRVDGTDMIEFKPNMNFAHMYAQTTANPATDDGVLLQFHPLVTTFEITLVNMATDPIAAKLKKARLVSGNNDLAGSFTADLAKGAASPEINEVASSTFKKNYVMVDFGEGVNLSDDVPVKFTFLTLPLDQSQVKLELLFEGGMTRSVDLKYDADSDGEKDDWIEVGACKKVYITNMVVPNEWTYFIDNLSCPVVDGIGEIYIETDEEGSAASAGVQYDSYKMDSNGNKVRVVTPKVEYSANGEDGWTTSLPSAFFADPFAPVTFGTDLRMDATASATAFAPSEKIVETTDAGARHTTILRSRSAVGTESSPRDLSLYTVDGVSRGKRVTANCYVVDRGGWYKFPLVYGNAIDQVKIAGEGVNTDSYAPGALSSSSYFVQNFQNYLGNGITSPYILTDTGLGVNDVEAVVVWGDRESNSDTELLGNSDVTVLDEAIGTSSVGRGFIRLWFDRNKLHQGNLLIALRKKSDKTILWSWHIWVSDLSMKTVRMSTENSKIPASVYSPVRSYTDFMEYNLGWCEEGLTTIIAFVRAPYYVRVTQVDEFGEHLSQVFKVIERGGTELHAAMSSGTYYQWGRKDPFLPSSGQVETAILRVNNPISTTGNKPHYAPADGDGFSYQIPHDPGPSGTTPSYELSEKALNYQAPSTSDFGESIRNPYVFYHNGSYENWRTGISCNLWDARFTPNDDDLIPVKTIYDPCPPGFVVPNFSAFFNFIGKPITRLTAYEPHPAMEFSLRTVELTDDRPPQILDDFNYFNVIDMNGDKEISDDDFERGFYFRKNGTNTNEHEGIVSGRSEGLYFPAAGYRLPGAFTGDTVLQSDVYEMGLEGWYWTSSMLTPYGGIDFLFSTHYIHAGTGGFSQGFNMMYSVFKSSLALSIRAMADE